MEKQKFSRGMVVIIPKKLTHTRKRFTITMQMRELIGTVQSVGGVRHDSIIIDGWSWDPKDFKTPKIKKIAIKHFDPEELVT